MMKRSDLLSRPKRPREHHQEADFDPQSRHLFSGFG
jgi:hypothetical protein